MTRRGPRPGALAGAEAATTAAAAAWRAHGKLCWTCHAAGRRPGLFCDEGFRLAQAVAVARFAEAAARSAVARAQGRLL